jgi:hypothetical protein
MGSPYLSSNESIILSTNNIIVNTVPAEAILTNERFILIDSGHAEFQPQDIPFTAIETVTTGENSDMDPMLSLSLVTGPGVTQAMGIVFPQPPRMKRIAERDEWAPRIKELSAMATRGGTMPMTILPPWVPGPLPDETAGGLPPALNPEAESKFKNPPLAPRKPREPAAPKNRVAIAAIIVVVIAIALVAGAYLFAPSLFGKGGTPPPPVTLTTTPTPLPTTIVKPTVTPAATIQVTITPTAAPVIPVPQKGVWLRVKYEGPFSGTAGAPGRYRDIADTGDHLYQLSVKNESVFISIQKQDNTGRKMTVELYNEGKLLKSVSVTAPKGIVNIDADLRTP